jgi:hypothetical protein
MVSPSKKKKMKLTCWFASAALLLPSVALAQMNDADYCRALSARYQTLVGSVDRGHNPQPAPVDAQTAIEQCKAGNTAAGIPVLEHKLRDAKVDLPKRG